jgi:hypothetical protein
MTHIRISLVLAVAVLGLLLALPRHGRQDRDRQRPTGATPRHESAATADSNATPGGGPAGGDVFSIAIDPYTPTTAYAAAEDSVYKSVDVLLIVVLPGSL